MAEERDDVEVAWARIVADYDREVDDTVGRWPVAEDIVDAPGEAPLDAPDDAATSGRPWTDQAVRQLGPGPADDGPGRSDRAAGDDEWLAAGRGLDSDPGHELRRDPAPDAGREPEHHFVPPVPPPLPRPDLPTGLAWAGVLGSPVVLLLAAMLAWDLPRLLTAACIVGFVGGMVFLVANMDDGSSRDGWDDGAQV